VAISPEPFLSGRRCLDSASLLLAFENGFFLREYISQDVPGVIDTRRAAAYRLMIVSINSLCQKNLGRTFPILVHGYDYPVPDGRGFLGGGGLLPGLWLKPGFDEKLFGDINVTTQMMTIVIDRFNTMLQNLVQEPGFQNVTYIDLRKTLSNSRPTTRTRGPTKSIQTLVAFSEVKMAGEPLPQSFKPSLRRFPNHASKVRPSSGLQACVGSPF
jgi:hypothetical protein